MTRRLALALLAIFALILGGVLHAAERAAPVPIWLAALCAAGTAEGGAADEGGKAPAHCPDCLLPASLPAAPASGTGPGPLARRRAPALRRNPARRRPAPPCPPARGPPQALC